MAKITKNMCRNFLRKVEAKALTSIDIKYRELTNEAIMRDIEKYPTLKNKLEESINKIREAKDLLEDFHKEVINLGIYKEESKNSKESVFNALMYNNYFMRYIAYLDENYLDVDYIVKNLSRDIRFDEYEKVSEEYTTERQEVGKNYSLVREELDLAKSGKQCYEILNKLGFDTSSIDKEVEINGQSIVDIVDKSKLFVCGETK